MRHQNFLPPGLNFFLTPFLAFLIITGFIGCKDNKKENDNSPYVQTGIAGFKMNCVILNKSQIQVWVDSGWTNPAYPNRIKTLLFQFYTASGANASENMQLITYPGQNLMDVRMTGKANLTIDTSCTSLDLSGAAILANNSINIKDLKILNTDGTLKDFDFIRLRPVMGPGEYVSFEIEVVKRVEKKESILMKEATHPCPPYCPPPPGGGVDE